MQYPPNPWRPLLAAAWITGLAAGCGQSSQPLPIHYGLDRCAECHMIIIHRRFAAEIEETDGRREKFDDVGCLFRWVGTHGGWGLVNGAWVKDFQTRQWLPLRRASYVYDPENPSPMSYDMPAFAGRRQALTFMHTHSGPMKLLTYRQLTTWRWMPHRSPGRQQPGSGMAGMSRPG